MPAHTHPSSPRGAESHAHRHVHMCAPRACPRACSPVRPSLPALPCFLPPPCNTCKPHGRPPPPPPPTHTPLSPHYSHPIGLPHAGPTPLLWDAAVTFLSRMPHGVCRAARKQTQAPRNAVGTGGHPTNVCGLPAATAVPCCYPLLRGASPLCRCHCVAAARTAAPLPYVSMPMPMPLRFHLVLRARGRGPNPTVVFARSSFRAVRAHALLHHVLSNRLLPGPSRPR